MVALLAIALSHLVVVWGRKMAVSQLDRSAKSVLAVITDCCWSGLVSMSESADEHVLFGLSGLSDLLSFCYMVSHKAHRLSLDLAYIGSKIWKQVVRLSVWAPSPVFLAVLGAVSLRDQMGVRQGAVCNESPASVARRPLEAVGCIS